jgi:hypothetical protein
VGWERTGFRFLAYDTQVAGTNPVCRFYRPPPYGDSHFYSASPKECADTAAVHATDWIYESPAAFYIALPNTTTGTCPTGTLPVWRFFNQLTTNYRYTTDVATRDDMSSQPAVWTAEGYGPGPSFPSMCTPVEVEIAASTGSFSMNQQGLTGIWYEPATSGQGFGIEVYPNLVASGTGFAQLSWFTFDSGAAGGADKQRWYTAGGAVSGGTTASLAIYQNTGGNFNAGPITAAQQVGTGTLAFTACDAAQLTYSFSDGSGRAGVVPLTRITPNVTCSTSSARPTNADFALSGNWFDPSTSGQGFFFEVNPNSPVFYFAWYTYAPDGQAAGASGQRWYTGQTSYQSGARTFTMPIFQTTGGVFDTNTPVSQSTVQVGTATVTFASCTTATLMYAFTSGTNSGLSGTIALKRVGPTAIGCVA